jgi:hypothetical protein
MTTTTLPTPPTVPRRSLRATGKTNKVRDDSEEEERQEKRQPSLNTMGKGLGLGGSHRISRGSVTVDRNKKGSGKDPRIGTVAGLKAHDNVSRISNNDNNDEGDGKHETLASNGQKVEASKTRNLGKMEVDPAFVVLKPTHRSFCKHKASPAR